ncbi:MAG: ABC-F family ATP-binding cassette domain-containing protein [Acetobacteraceae bacterium]|nr:ABC-F family ATP-binding cassette domain-containing protein [Acetobacteraceae bacterium]
MSLINIRGVGIVSPRPLFHNLDLAIHASDRIGLIAGNGAGKTTLLRCLAGQMEPGMGQITNRRGLRVGFVEQDVPANLLDLTMAEALRRALPAAEREAQTWKIGLVLDMLETPEAMRERRLSELSGGWQRLALIARVWVNDPDVLLLDEPTNHLDMRRFAVLENWINHATEGVAMVIASHDRQFLDNCTNRTLFLRPDESRSYAHPFSRARGLLEDDDTAHETKLARDAKEADRLRRNAGQLRNVGINSGSDLLLKKAKYLTNRAEAIEQLLRPLVQTRAGEIRLTNRGSHAKVLMSLDEVAVETPDGKMLFRTGTLKIFQRDRIVVTGANGVGKSVFVRLLRRAIAGDAVPGISVSPSVVLGYVDQQMSQLPSAETLLGFVAGQFRLGDQRSVSLLASAGFDYDAQRRPIARLSPGQKARLGLLALRLTEPNFYLMDEPTNHVDIVGQERLEAEILAHEATCVLVSHDRFFVRAIGTRFLCIEDGRAREMEAPEA